MKPQELAFYKAVWDAHQHRDPHEHKYPGDIAKELDIPEKRAHYWLEKWIRKGWFECGVSVRTGWLTDSAPNPEDLEKGGGV